jgi:archaellum component FlaG (FlaF/FlaG flagellin family)
MDEVVKINVGDFEKKPDGSWVTIKNSNINTKNGNTITLSPGMTFKKGFKQFGGLDIVKALEESSSVN